MAYGDAAAALMGQKYGRHTYNVFGKKSIEGSTVMFIICFLALWLSLIFFSFLYVLPLDRLLIAAFSVSIVATFFEALTPKGLDNLTVPFFSALTFLLVMGGL